MPGQEKLIFDYYQKNPSATQSLKGSLYEEKIINLIKSKIKFQKEILILKRQKMSFLNLIKTLNRKKK